MTNRADHPAKILKTFVCIAAAFTMGSCTAIGMQAKSADDIALLNPQRFIHKSITESEKVLGKPRYTAGVGTGNHENYGTSRQIRYYKVSGLTRIVLVRVAEESNQSDQSARDQKRRLLRETVDALEYQIPQERVNTWQEAFRLLGVGTEGVTVKAFPGGVLRLSNIPGGYGAGWTPAGMPSTKDPLAAGKENYLLLMYPSEGRYHAAATSAATRAIRALSPAKRIDPERLPQPYHTSSIDAEPRYVRGQGDPPLKAPEGFVVEPFARDLLSPRWMTVASNGDVFVTESYQGRITLLRDEDGDGKPEARYTFATGLRLPHGLALQGEWLYVGNTDSVVRFGYQEGQTEASGPPESVVSGLPALGRKQHWTRNLVFEPDGEHFLVTVGSASNKGVESAPRATIVRYRSDGSGRETFASGLRNPVGIGFRPGTNELWTTCVERDFMGDDLVPDFFTKVEKGDFFGWPWYYIGKHLDPRAPKGAPRRKVAVPAVLFTAHSVPLGMLFYTGENFPSRYQGDVFVAMRGSTNRRISSGYRVVRIPFLNGYPSGGYEDFVTGWIADSRQHLVYGRPVGLVQWTDGSLLVSDEAGHMIWRVRYIDALNQLR